jgi:hypothetical protein
VDKHKIVADCLKDFGFGVTIEVTNGMNNGYCSKAGQALKAKDFLYDLTSKESHIATGVACLMTNVEVDLSMGINVLLQVSKYGHKRLEGVLTKMLDSVPLSEGEGGLVQKMLTKKNREYDLPGFISGTDHELRQRARYLGMSGNSYMNLLPNLKGFIMELYIASLFEERLADKHIFHRHGFSYKKGRRSDADVIVVCQESHFYNAVERMDTSNNVSTKVLTREK